MVADRFSARMLEYAQQVRHIQPGALFALDVQHNLPLMQHHGAIPIIERLTHAERHHHGRQLALGHDFGSQLQDKIGDLRI